MSASAERYARVEIRATGERRYAVLTPDSSARLLDAAPWDPRGILYSPVILRNGEYRLLAPSEPTKIIAVGKNYLEHANEMGGQVPKEPLLFLKPPSSVLKPGGKIRYPKLSERVDYEGELALIIGTTPEGSPTLWGYSIANDVTARDLQKKDGQWTRAKGFDTFCPLGPWVVREIAPDARLQTFVNDRPEPVQSASLHEMVFSPEAILKAVSAVMTLCPGDVILTGTPAGIGPLKPGDRVRVEIQGIGCLENQVE